MIRRAIGQAKKVAKLLLRPDFRLQEEESRAAFIAFKAETHSLWCDQPTFPVAHKSVLVVSGGFPNAATQELLYIKAMQSAGYAPVILMERNRWLEKFYRLWGIERLIFWGDFLTAAPRVADLSHLQTFEDVLNFTYKGTKVGKYVASRLMRDLRVGHFDPRDRDVWPKLLVSVTQGIQYSDAASRILDETLPTSALFLERGYNPFGQTFDLCLQRGVDTMQWCGSHKDNAHTLKRYTPANEHMHQSTLSKRSWELVQKMSWGSEKGQQLRDELHKNYATGQWFGEVGTQFHKQMRTGSQLRSDLKLDPDRKTAIIFSHLFWDATFFFGTDLFQDYEDWFVQTVRAAVENPELNWVVKIHPANLVKNERDGFEGELSEMAVIREHIGSLPAHVSLIPVESEINTYSLFSVMDYCVTVRGTIGIEASSFGIPTLTAGTGRYDGLGFTIDSETTTEYLTRLAQIQAIEPLSPEQQELAQRFAYAIFLMRPFRMSSASVEYQQDVSASTRFALNVQSMSDLVDAPDMRAFIEWACCSTDEDFLQGDDSVPTL